MNPQDCAPGAIPEFQSFPKIPRLSGECIITEKIDGTNACVLVLSDDRVIAGFRSKWITPEDDNMGFARWVKEHEEELRKGLGYGLHFGEWWGAGIQRRYGLKEKRFSLFNTTRWTGGTTPAICSVVPELYRGPFDTGMAGYYINQLAEKGSRAAPGFMQPEGIVIFHVAGGFLFKKTIEKDSEPKGKGE